MCGHGLKYILGRNSVDSHETRHTVKLYGTWRCCLQWNYGWGDYCLLYGYLTDATVDSSRYLLMFEQIWHLHCRQTFVLRRAAISLEDGRIRSPSWPTTLLHTAHCWGRPCRSHEVAIGWHFPCNHQICSIWMMALQTLETIVKILYIWWKHHLDRSPE